VGCVWAFGGFVPKDCVSGGMGNTFAFSTMWYAAPPRTKATTWANWHGEAREWGWPS
jgi:hypothetical protein